jgi:photosystem II stability/assembly factor-like uncharacterized protein
MPLAMDPSDSSTLYAAPQDDADCGAYVYNTSDAGADWNQTFTGGGFVTALVIQSGNPPTLYAGLNYIGLNGGVSKSTDSGKTWIRTALTDVRVNVLMLDPTNSSILYAGTSMGLFKTIDDGATWSAIKTGLAASTPITALAIDPNRSVVYLGASEGGVFKSIDGGTRWTPMNDGLPNLDINALAVSSDGSGTIYAGTSQGAFTTIDKQADKLVDEQEDTHRRRGRAMPR